MSYIEHFNLKEQPFNIAVDNRFFFKGKHHADALVRLLHAARERKGLGLLVGDVGAGKTTLAQRLLDELPESEFESAMLVIIHASVTPQWMLRKIAIQLGVENASERPTELLTQLHERLVEIHENGKKAVVLIDEAQMLHSKEVMEEFRGILNIEQNGHKLITFIFFGLPETDEVLALDEPLRQRVALRFHLQNFSPDATRDYIKFRLRIAGAVEELFTEPAFGAVFQYSKGVPRLINAICDNALLESFLRKKARIDHDMIREVAADLKLATA